MENGKWKAEGGQTSVCHLPFSIYHLPSAQCDRLSLEIHDQHADFPFAQNRPDRHQPPVARRRVNEGVFLVRREDVVWITLRREDDLAALLIDRQQAVIAAAQI